MKNFFNGLLAFVGIALLLIFDKEQRELYNISIGEAEDKGE